MGLASASSSFCFSVYSSMDASCDASSQDMASLTAVSSLVLSAGSNFPASFSSVSELRRLYEYDSRPFLAEMRAAAASSSAKVMRQNRAHNSSSCHLPLYFSASLTIRSISSFDRRPLSLVIVIRLDLPVVLSAAETFKMPFASISKVTST